MPNGSEISNSTGPDPALEGEAGLTSLVVSSREYLFLVAEMVFMLVILVGNGLTITAICTTPSLQTNTYRFVASLAVADLLVGLSLPYHGAFFISPGLAAVKYPCFIRFAAIILTAAASIYSLLCISIDRFLAVIYPLRYSAIMTPHRATGVIALLWVHAIFTGLGPFYCGRWDPGNTDCLFSEVLPPEFTLTLLTGQYTLYVSIMVVLYAKIFYVANRHKTQIHALEAATAGEDVKKDPKSTKTLALVLGVFIVCWTPFFIFASLQTLGFHPDRLNSLYVVAILMGLMNSGLNPVIYCWKSSEFRLAFSRLLRQRCRSRPEPLHVQSHCPSHFSISHQ